MKYLKKFNDLNEGKGRYKVDGNMAVDSDVSLPQFFTTSKDYMKQDHSKDPQEPGHDPKQMIAPVGNDYSYITDIDDHIDDKEVKKLIEPHVKKFNDFGFDPSEKTKTKK